MRVDYDIQCPVETHQPDWTYPMARFRVWRWLCACLLAWDLDGRPDICCRGPHRVVRRVPLTRVWVDGIPVESLAAPFPGNVGDVSPLADGKMHRITMAFHNQPARGGGSAG